MSDVFSRIRRRLETTLESQEELAQEREGLLIEREHVLARSKLKREQRLNFEAAVDALQNQFHEVLSQLHVPVPTSLDHAYEKFRDESSKLGGLEDDLIQAETSLTASEWTFMEKENDFYQMDLDEAFANEFFHDLPKDSQQMVEPRPDFSHNYPTEYSEALARRGRLMKTFDSLRPEQAQIWDVQELPDPSNVVQSLNDPDTAPFFSRYSEILTQIVENEVDIRHARDGLLRHENYISITTQRDLDSTQPTQTMHNLDAKPQAYSFSQLQNLPNNLSTRQRIEEWLLENLTSSAFERARYLNVLKHDLASSGITPLHSSSWVDLTSDFWSIGDSSNHAPGEDMAGHFWFSRRHGSFSATGADSSSLSHRTSQDPQFLRGSHVSILSQAGRSVPDIDYGTFPLDFEIDVDDVPHQATDHSLDFPGDTSTEEIPMVILSPQSISQEETIMEVPGLLVSVSPSLSALPDVHQNLDLAVSPAEHTNIMDHLQVQSTRALSPGSMSSRHDSVHPSDVDEPRRALECTEIDDRRVDDMPVGDSPPVGRFDDAHDTPPCRKKEFVQSPSLDQAIEPMPLDLEVNKSGLLEPSRGVQICRSDVVDRYGGKASSKVFDFLITITNLHRLPCTFKCGRSLYLYQTPISGALCAVIPQTSDRTYKSSISVAQKHPIAPIECHFARNTTYTLP